MQVQEDHVKRLVPQTLQGFLSAGRLFRFIPKSDKGLLEAGAQ